MNVYVRDPAVSECVIMWSTNVYVRGPAVRERVRARPVVKECVNTASGNECSVATSV